MSTFINPMEEKLKEWKAKADAGSSSAAKNYAYYSSGAGYQSMFRDWQLAEAEKTASSLGITPAQLVTNPQLATDPVALAKYKGVPYGGVDYSVGSPTWQAAQTNTIQTSKEVQVLTPEQITQYYTSEGKKANPISPLAWLAQQSASYKNDNNIPQELSNGTNGGNWQISDIKLPEPNMATANGAYAGMNSEITSLQKQLEANKKEIEAAQATASDKSKSWLSAFTGANNLDIEAKRKEMENKYGVDQEYITKRTEKLAEIDALKSSYNNAVAKRDLELSAERDRLAPQGFITAKMSRMERDANIQLNQMSANINSKLGIMELERGNFMDAQSLINQAVSDYTAQYKWEYDVTKDFMDTNYKIIQDLKQEKQSILNSALDIKLKTWQMQLDQTTNIGKLMLDYPKAGIKINDSLEEAMRKASIWNAQYGTTETETINNSGVVYDEYGQGYSTAFPESYNQYTFTNTQLNKGASNANMDLATFSKLDGVSKNYFINNASGLKAAKEVINTGISNKESKESLLVTIQSSQAPQGVKSHLVAYLNAKYPATKTITKQWYEFWK